MTAKETSQAECLTTKTDEWGEILESVQIPAPFIRTAFNYDKDLASLLSGLQCPEETRTQQQFGEECDINTIVRRFGLTGELPENLNVPLTGNFEDVVDYHTAINQVHAADAAFMQMPAEIRERFGNNAGKFVDFVSDPKNIGQCREWGLARPVEAPREPIEVRVIPTPSGDEKKA